MQTVKKNHCSGHTASVTYTYLLTIQNYNNGDVNKYLLTVLLYSFNVF